MATLGELIDSAERRIRDSYYTRTILRGLFNQALREVAGTLPVPLPYLETTANLTTLLVASNVALPTTPSVYQRDLDYCYSTAINDEVKVYGSLELLAAEDPSLSLAGEVIGVAISGDNLWYVRRPSVADTLRIHFYRKPETLTTESGIPYCLPDHLHEKLLVNRVCELVFEEIEDGIEGDKVNANRYAEKYKEAFAELIYWIGPKHKRPVIVNDIMSLEFE